MLKDIYGQPSEEFNFALDKLFLIDAGNVLRNR